MRDPRIKKIRGEIKEIEEEKAAAEKKRDKLSARVEKAMDEVRLLASFAFCFCCAGLRRT